MIRVMSICVVLCVGFGAQLKAQQDYPPFQEDEDPPVVKVTCYELEEVTCSTFGEDAGCGTITRTVKAIMVRGVMQFAFDYRCSKKEKYSPFHGVTVDAAKPKGGIKTPVGMDNVSPGTGLDFETNYDVACARVDACIIDTVFDLDEIEFVNGVSGHPCGVGEELDDYMAPNDSLTGLQCFVTSEEPPVDPVDPAPSPAEENPVDDGGGGGP